jgi:hypothetical protein
MNQLLADKSAVTYAAPKLYAQESIAKVHVFSFSFIFYEVIVERVVSARQGHSKFRTMYMAQNDIREKSPPGL